jgi:hypothetical protein
MTAQMNDGTYLTSANWEHVRSGVTYCIEGLSTRESDGMTLVHYRAAMGTDTPVWTREAFEFFDGRFVRLFPGYQRREARGDE